MANISFSREVREEIALKEFDPCCQKALLSALLKINGSLMLTSDGLSISLVTENAKVASLSHRILKELYQPTIEFKVTHKKKLKKNNVYTVIVRQARGICEDLGIFLGISDIPQGSVTRKECCKRAFLAGCFLASGSVNSFHRTDYHFEVSFAKEELALFAQYLMNEKFGLNAKIVERRKKYVVYIKSVESICDALRVISATSAAFKYETARIDRDYMNSINRLENCQIANEQKTVATGMKQIEDIRLIDKYLGLEALDDKTCMLAKIRLEYPDSSLADIADTYEKTTGLTISKSNVHHQFAKIKKEAARLREVHGE